LAKPENPHFAAASDALKINFNGNKLFTCTGLIEYAAIRTADN
jgi:hypothetical protein